MILLIDNYDSFTYNLVQRIGELDAQLGDTLRVVRNDKITPDQAQALSPTHVIISPGPCTPKEAGVSCAMIEKFAGKVPLLGVCLGHQSIGAVFGMTVARNHTLMHGKTSEMYHDGQSLFAGLENPFVATRYHSLVVTPESFDHTRFEITAWTEQADKPGSVYEIMAMRAKPGVFGDAPLEGVQFHPESFLTDAGPKMIANFLGITHAAAAS